MSLLKIKLILSNKIRKLEEILFCIVAEFLFILNYLQFMGLSEMIKFFSFDGIFDCMVRCLCLFFILTCVWLVARETYHVFVVKDGKGILEWLVETSL